MLAELASKPGWWQVWVDTRAVGHALFLGSSHGRFHPIATAESWDGGSRACNRYRFRFSQVAVLSGVGDWAVPRKSYVLVDPGQQVIRRGLASFLARGER